MHAPADTTNAPIVAPFLPYGLFGFKHREDSRHGQPLEPEETILAILYDKKGQAEFVLTNRTEYGITYCADGINVRNEDCNFLSLTATGDLAITRSSHTRVWIHPHLVGGFSHQGQPITREQAAALGWIQLDTPSAGLGALIKAIQRQSKNPPQFIDACEPQDEFVATLETLGATHVAYDFADYRPQPIYDAVIMNPPYKKRMARIHVDHAWNCLKSGGRLVALVGSGDTAYIDDEYSGHVFERDIIPKGTFAETNIETCLYLIHKPLYV